MPDLSRETKPDEEQTEDFDDLLRIYRQEFARIDQLTAAQEQQLGIDMEAGGLKAEKARKTLINANLRLVDSIAQQSRGRGVDLSDLIQEGNLGLIRAAEKWDYRRHIRFATYARWWIQRFVSQAVRQAPRRTVSLDLPAGKNTLPMAEAIPVKNDLSPEDVAEQLGSGDEVKDLVKRLPVKERRVIELRYGLVHGRNHTRQECSAVMGVSNWTVRQLEKNALARLRKRRGDVKKRDL